MSDLPVHCMPLCKAAGHREIQWTGRFRRSVISPVQSSGKCSRCALLGQPQRQVIIP